MGFHGFEQFSVPAQACYLEFIYENQGIARAYAIAAKEREGWAFYDLPYSRDACADSKQGSNNKQGGTGSC